MHFGFFIFACRISVTVKVMRFFFLFWPLFLGPAHADNLARTPEWLALLHYEGSGSSYKSSAKGAAFFLSAQGNENPEAELAASVAAFAAPVPADSNEHAQCRFPARFVFVRKNFPTQNFPSVPCDRFEKWRDAIQAKSLSLIFASAFVNSPGSMYGHTFLRFSRGGKTEGNPLLDYALSYGADIGDTGGISYIFKALVGLFSGPFTTAPYYLKVQEYNHVENRDFWEYELDLTVEEVALLVAHAWELKAATFPYYFFKRNCAYYLLKYLEVVRPSLHLADAFSFWTIPVDTIRALQEQRLLKKAKLRASRANILLERRSHLREEELTVAEDFAENPAAIFFDEILPERKALILDAAYELFRYRSNAINTLTPEQQLKEKNILRARGAIPLPQQTPDFSSMLPPEAGHDTVRAGIFSGKDKKHFLGEIRYRGALHDLLSDPTGFEPGSELTMGDFHARYTENSIFLDFMELLKIRSIAPFDPWIKKTSWNISVGMDRAKERDCKSWNCSFGFIDGGAGFAFSLNPENLFFLFLNGTLDAGAVLDSHWRFGVGPTIGLKLHPVSFWRVLFSTQYRTKVLGDKEGRKSLRLEQSFRLKRDNEIRLEVEQRRSYREFLLGHYWYY